MAKTFTLHGTAPEVTAHFFPPIHLDPGSEFVIGLVSLETYNSIPNVDDYNNKFYCSAFGNPIVIPVGSYEVEAIEKYLRNLLGSSKISLKANNSTLRCEIESEHEIDFSKPDTLGPLLGFPGAKLEPNLKHISFAPVDISKVKIVRVNCNLVKGSFMNGEPSHTLHEFSPSVPVGYRLIQVPANVIYLPVNTNTIDTIVIRLVDQDGQLINFRGEKVNLRLHLKPWVSTST